MKSTLFLSAATLLFSAAQAQVADTTGTNTNAGTMDTTTQAVGTNNTMATAGNMGTTSVDNARKLNQYGSYSTRDSIAAKYKLLPMPGAQSIDKVFPILGTYQLNNAPETTGTAATATGSTASAGSTDSTLTTTDASAAYGTQQVTITLDSASKGIVWVEGLEQGRFKAYLKKSPATYRIVAQKPVDGTAIPEGTMHLDTATKTLHIAMGAAYQEADPTAVFYQDAAMVDDATAAADTKVKSKNAKTKAKPKVKIITATKVDAVEPQATGVDATQQSGQQMQQNQQ